MKVYVLVFSNYRQARLFFERSEWQALLPHLTQLGRYHWRMASGDELYVMTALGENVQVFRRWSNVTVYVFYDASSVPLPRAQLLYQSLKEMGDQQQIELHTISMSRTVDWQQLGIAAPEVEG